MIEIPTHQKLTYSRRRKIRAKEVSDKLEKLERNEEVELQLRDWIYVKSLEGDKKSRFQREREEHERRKASKIDEDNENFQDEESITNTESSSTFSKETDD